MAEQLVSTSVAKKEFDAINTPAVKEDCNATTPHESSVINSPPGGQGQLRKRKYEEATEEEKLALNSYHITNPHLKQRELAEWFKNQYGKSINQSTVSRNLKKFKSSPPSSKESGLSQPEPSPTKRDRKPFNPRSPPQKKIQIPKQLLPTTPSGVSLPPTPPPRDTRTTRIDPPLYEFYRNYRKSNPGATAEDCDKEIKAEAQKLLASQRQPPPPEMIHETVIDDAWITGWKRAHDIPAHSLSLTECFGAPTAITPDRQSVSEGDRTCSEETEPRSPVSTVSSTEHRSLELSPIKNTPVHTQPPTSAQLNGTNESPETRRRRQIEQVKKDIEKKDLRIEHEQRKRDSLVRKLEKLERSMAGTQ